MGIVENIERMREQRLRLGERAYRRGRALELLERMSLGRASELIGCAKTTLYNDCKKDPEFAKRVALAREKWRLSRKDRRSGKVKKHSLQREWPTPDVVREIPNSENSVTRVEGFVVNGELQKVHIRRCYWLERDDPATRRPRGCVPVKVQDVRKLIDVLGEMMIAVSSAGMSRAPEPLAMEPGS
jgi:hypothetical protein